MQGDSTPAGKPRRIPLRYPGSCVRCGCSLAVGTAAMYDKTTKTVWCVQCPPAEPAPSPTPVDVGVAGASARREHDRRLARLEARRKERWGERVGGWINRLADEPQSTRAWAIGAAGEEALQRALAEVPGVLILNDRRVPRTRGNIDHIVIGPAGVFVVDAKRYRGLIEVRNKGWFFKPDYRLYVGRRDRSGDADGLRWQVEAVEAALKDSGLHPLPPITPVLCYIDGEWPFFRAPNEYAGVRLEGPKSLKELVTATNVLDPGQVDDVWRVLAVQLPAKVLRTEVQVPGSQDRSVAPPRRR